MRLFCKNISNIVKKLSTLRRMRVKQGKYQVAQPSGDGFQQDRSQDELPQALLAENYAIKFPTKKKQQHHQASVFAKSLLNYRLQTCTCASTRRNGVPTKKFNSEFDGINMKFAQRPNHHG